MKEKYRYLSKNIFLFSLSGIVPKILSFILIPIYTGYLTTTEYGISDLIATTASLLIPIFTVDIQDAVMRFSLDDNFRNDDVFSTGISTILKGGFFVTLGALVVSFLHLKGIENLYLIFVVIMYFTMACNNTFSLFCRGIDQIRVIAVSSIVNSVVTLSTNILFLVCFHWGLVGYLVANTIGAFLSLIYIFIRAQLYQYIHFHVPASVRKEMFAFSFPLIFSVVAWWVNNASDRYILSWMAGVSLSGVYAVAYKIPNLLTTFQNIFAQAWSISAIKEFDENDSDGFIGNTYTLMNFAMVLLCSGIMIFNVPVARILYSNDFFVAWKYVPPLLISVLFNAMALFIGSIFTAVKDTRTLAVSTIVGAIVNVICNFIFIFYWKAYGAAMATLVGYCSTFLMRHIILRKYIRMKIDFRRDSIAYGLLLIQMIISNWGWKTIPLQGIVFVLIIMLYKVEARKITAIIRNKLHKNIAGKSEN